MAQKRQSADSEREDRPRLRRGGSAGSESKNSPMLSELRKLRAKLASEAGVPAYIIFSNATLSDMAQKVPHTTQELLRVSGVGEVKAARYGAKFLEVIRGMAGCEVEI